VQGLIQLLGGRQAFTNQLDQFFSIRAVNPNKHLGQEAMIGQYAHGNEPSHHIAYLYAYSDKPEAGKAIISRICREFYGNKPSGMIGNDDCGQMSAWYIFASLGFYPVNPASGEYVLGAPQVKGVTIRLNGGKAFRMRREGRDLPVWNNKTIHAPTISHRAIAAGGELIF
jgi:putative alpha-1,2-mannosidase